MRSIGQPSTLARIIREAVERHQLAEDDSRTGGRGGVGAVHLRNDRRARE